jgi:hypothetical protein
MTMTERDLLDVIDAYASAESLPDVTISSRVFKDSKKLRAIRDGSDITVRRLNDALEWLSANWPNGAAWPAHVDRPVSRSGEAA